MDLEDLSRVNGFSFQTNHVLAYELKELPQ
jgi:hypothetical protein